MADAHVIDLSRAHTLRAPSGARIHLLPGPLGTPETLSKALEPLILRTLPGYGSGKVAYLMATRSDADCNVSYYGVGIEGYLKEAENLKSPLLMHIGETDPWTPPPVRRALDAALSPLGVVEAHTYDGVGHAFAREGASADVPDARVLANGRSAAFFKRTVGLA